MKLVDLIGITSIMEVCFCFLLDFTSAKRRVIENEALKQSSPLWEVVDPSGRIVFSCNTHSEGNPMRMTMTAWWWIWLTKLGLFSSIDSVLVCRFWYDWLEPMNIFMPFMWIPYNGWRILICWRCLWTSLVLWYSLFALPVASPLKILSKKSVRNICGYEVYQGSCFSK